MHNEIQCEKMNLLLCRNLVPAMCAGKRPLPFKIEPAPTQRRTGKKMIFMLDQEWELRNTWHAMLFRDDARTWICTQESLCSQVYADTSYTIPTHAHTYTQNPHVYVLMSMMMLIYSCKCDHSHTRMHTWAQWGIHAYVYMSTVMPHMSAIMLKYDVYT